MTKTCSRPNCHSTARYIPRLSMFAFPGATPAVMYFNLPLCHWHKRVKPADLVTDETWAGLVIAVVGAGKLAPRRDLNCIDPVGITSHEAREFFRLLDRGRGEKITTPRLQ